MKNNTYYFPHDFNSHSDPKIIMLIKNYGLLGYGLFWLIVEMMHEQSDKMLTEDEIKGIISLYADEDEIIHGEDCLNFMIKLNLLTRQEESGKLFSKRVNENINEREELSKMRSEIGKLGGIRSGEARRMANQNEPKVKPNEPPLQKIEPNEAKERKGKEIKEERAKPFLPPSPEEVNKYCQERKNGISGNQFVDFYISKGWMIGSSKMKDWKAAVRTWEKRDNYPNNNQMALPVEERRIL